MKKYALTLAAVIAGLMTTSVLAGNSQPRSVESQQETRVLTPVVKIIALSGERAREFNAARERFREVLSEVVESNDMYLDQLLADADIQH